MHILLTAAEFNKILEHENPNTLVVVDFYKTACGSCRYIQPGFVKLCRNVEEEHAPVVFLKHNVIDEWASDSWSQPEAGGQTLCISIETIACQASTSFVGVHLQTPFDIGRRDFLKKAWILTDLIIASEDSLIDVAPNSLHCILIDLKNQCVCRADEDTDLSEMLRIRNVPLFQFYKEGELLEQFATRDKNRIGNAINRYVGHEVCHFWSTAFMWWRTACIVLVRHLWHSFKVLASGRLSVLFCSELEQTAVVFGLVLNLLFPCLKALSSHLWEHCVP